jgi:DNA-binding CsgD family transcriptional regulator
VTVPRKPLTERELEILHRFTLGVTHVQTAGSLGVGVDTVKKHTGAILRKLGARNRAHAVAIGYRTGLLGDHVDRKYGAAGVGR